MRPLPQQLLGKLAATDTRPAIMLLETLLLPGLAIALGLLLHPQDPIWSEGDFPGHGSRPSSWRCATDRSPDWVAPWCCSRAGC